jgi:iron-sulfur cluster assembly protein
MTFPLNITKVAINKLIAAKEGDGLNDSFFIRISVKGGGCSGLLNELAFDSELDQDDDIAERFSADDKSIKVAIDSFSAMYMSNVTLDYVIEDMQEGFKFSGGGATRRHCACGSSFKE